MKKETSVYLVRHGETEWNTQHKLQGHTDIPLNRVGEFQALELHAQLRGEAIDAVFSSDLSRAHQTAEILSLHLPTLVTKHRSLRERAFGPFEGMTLDEYRAHYFSKQGHDHHPYESPFEAKWHPEVESTSEVLERTLSFISEQVKIHPGKTLLMVSHGGVLRSVLNYFNPDLPKFKISNCAYLHLKWPSRDAKPLLHAYEGVQHIEEKTLQNTLNRST